MPVASALPLAPAVGEIDAGEEAPVEAVGMALVNDEIVEVGLQPNRRPALFDGPSRGSMRDRDAAHADFPADSGAAAEQEVAAREYGRLHDAVAFPWVVPEELAVGRRDANRAGSVQQHDLRDAIDCRQMRRAIAPAALRAEPARIAGADVVGGEHAGGGDDDHVAKHQR